LLRLNLKMIRNGQRLFYLPISNCSASRWTVLLVCVCLTAACSFSLGYLTCWISCPESETEHFTAAWVWKALWQS
jgi:hypothetical protein